MVTSRITEGEKRILQVTIMVISVFSFSLLQCALHSAQSLIGSLKMNYCMMLKLHVEPVDVIKKKFIHGASYHLLTCIYSVQEKIDISKYTLKIHIPISKYNITDSETFI